MNLRKTAILSLLILVCASMVYAGRIETADESVSMDGAKKLVVDCDFGAGELFIVPKDIDEAAKLTVTYDTRHFDYSIDFSKRGDVGHLYLESDLRRSHNIDDADNEWNLVLSTKYPCEIEMDIGACDAEIDLGGIPLTNVSLDIGAAAGTIDFSRRNPERMDELKVDIGASSVEMYNLGNANFEFFEFSSGAASCELDFGGDFKGESEVTLDVGLGSVKVVIPDDIAVRIETDNDGWFSSVDFHYDNLDEVRDGVFETPDFDQADKRLIIEVEVGMGSADFYFK